MLSSVIRTLLPFVFIILSLGTLTASNPADSLFNLLQNTSDEKEQVTIYRDLARLFESNAPDKAIEYGTKARDLARKYDMHLQEGHAFNHLGLAYRYKSEYATAYEQYQEAIKCYERIDSKGDIAGTYSNIGVIHWMLGENQKALEYFELAYGIQEELKDSVGMTITLQNIGIQHAIKGESIKALEVFQRNYDLQGVLNDQAGQAKSLNNMARIYSDIKDYDNALKSIRQSLDFKIRSGDRYGEILGISGIGEIYVEMRKYKEAIAEFKKAIAIAEEINQVQSLADLNLTLANTYAEIGDYNKAYDYQEEYSRWRDTVTARGNKQKVMEMEAIYQAEKKQREIDRITSEKTLSDLKAKKEKTIRNYIIATAALLFAIALLLFNRFKMREKQKSDQLEMKSLDTEQRLLRAQMNPHFIFNSLNSIQSYITERETDIAERYLAKFARLMRNILEHTRSATISVSDEVETLDLYLQLERVRHDNKFDYEINIGDDVKSEDFQIPPMITQPFVENAILHGLRHKQGQGKLTISYSTQNGLMICRIEDNGIGREKSTEINEARHSKAPGRGMEVTRDRLEMMKSNTGLATGITFEDLKDDAGNPAGTAVEVRFPYQRF